MPQRPARRPAVYAGLNNRDGAECASLTEDAQRIAIAEACGFRPDVEKKIPHRKIWWGVIRKEHGEQSHTAQDLPDYPNDLNAMHEAIETLDIGDRSRWPIELRAIVVRGKRGQENPDTGRLDDTHFYNATAAQRSEAFLRTHDLWVDSPEQALA